MSIKIIISSLVSGLLSSMGFGGGTVLIIYLTVFEQVSQIKAQGINLFFFIPCAVFAIISYIKKGLINKSNLLNIVVPAMFGACVGYFAVDKLPSDTLGKMFGIFLILLGFSSSFKTVSTLLKEKNKKIQKKG